MVEWWNGEMDCMFAYSLYACTLVCLGIYIFCTFATLIIKIQNDESNSNF